MLNDTQCLAEWVLAIQSLGAWLAVPMRFLSFLGNGALYVAIVCAIYWNVDTHMGLRLGSLLAITIGLNSMIKLAGHTPRPYWCDPRVQAFSTESSFGFPSGHSQNAATFWLGLAWIVPRRRGWLLAVLITLLIGFSRLYLGVHSIADVAAGWLLGAMVLWIYLRVETPVAQWLARTSLGAQWLAISTFVATLLLFGVAARLSVGTSSVQAEWVANAARANPAARPIAPLRLRDTLFSLGALWGLAMGGAWLAARGSYRAMGSGKQRCLRYLVGVPGLVILGLAPYLSLPHTESWPFHVARFMVAAVVGLWISALAPLIFVRLGLAEWKAAV